MTTQTMPTRGGSFLIENTAPADVFTPEDFSQEAQLLAQTTRDFVQQEVVPVLDRLEKQEDGLMPSLLKKAGEIGLLAADVPEAYGGIAVDKSASMWIAESLAPGGSFPVAFGAHTGIGTLPIVYFGTPAQKQQWLPKLATGDILGAYALTETSSGSDALAAKATAKLVGDEWVLNGEKQFITNAGFADLFIVFAKIDGEQFSAFIVPRSAKGVSVGEEEKKMGIKGSSTRSLILSDARIPKDNLLGEAGRGHVIAFNILNVGRFKLGAGCTGGAKLCLNDGLAYAQERQQFGKPLVQFPLIAGKLAQMAARIFGAESAVYRTAGLLDAAVAAISATGDQHDREIIRAVEEFGIECSIIKVYGSEVLDYCADECVQIFGGYGFVSDYPAERYYRDSRINRIYEGTNEINRMLIPGMLLKRAMKGELPLLAAAKGVQEALMQIPDFSAEPDDAPFAIENEACNKLKQAALLVAGVAAQKYGPKLQEEQEVLAWIADMILELYGLESAVLRGRKLLAQGKPVDLVQDLVLVLASDAVETAGRAGRQALCHVSEGDDLRLQLAGLRRFSKPLASDLAAAQRRIAASLVERDGYRI